MNKKFCLGIDVSKSTLDCCLYDGKKLAHKKFGYSKTSIKRIMKWFSITPENCLVVMEATGIYHTRAFRSFFDAGFNVVADNPIKIKGYATMNMVKAKTDAADSKLIARYGFETNPAPMTPKDDYQERLRVYLKLIDGYNKDITRLRNRKEALKHNVVSVDIAINSIDIQIASIKDAIKNLKRIIRKEIKQNCEGLYQLFTSVPGVGDNLASTVIAVFGDFSRFESSKKAISFAGTCPKPDQSGIKEKKASITKQGNKSARKALFMSSLSASQHNKSCSDLYNRLVEKNKKGRLAMIAIANKLIRQLFAIARSGKKYDASYQLN